MNRAVTELLELYLDELYRWNARVNLTSIPRHLAWQRHVTESLSLLEASPPPEAAHIVDIGSGAGVPGIPIAIVRPDLRITLMDADTRKAGFLTHLSGLLKLANVIALALRAETAGRDPRWRGGFDVAVSRATASPAVLCELALPLVRTGGRLAALVTDAPAAVEDCAAASRHCGGALPVAVTPGVLVVSKTGPTPAAYPRRAGVPARHPLL